MKLDRILLLVAALVIIAFLADLVYRNRETNQLVMRTIEANNIRDQRYDELGREVTRATSNYITEAELRKSDDRVIDSLRKALIGPIRSLERTTRVISEKLDHITVPVKDTTLIINNEQVIGQAFDYKSEWFDIRGVMADGKMHLDYKMRSDLTLEYHWKPTGLFKPKELELMVRPADPGVHVSQVQQFQVVVPVPFWQRSGVQVGVGVLGGVVLHSLLSK